jgi:primosomal protein N''
MRQNILNILNAESSEHLSAEFIADKLHASVPAVLTELLALRALGSIRSWGSGQPVMLYWSKLT